MNRFLPVLILLLSVSTLPAQNTAIIAGAMPGAGRDTLRLFLQYNPTIRQSTTYTILTENGQFRQVIDLSRPVLCYLQNNGKGFNLLLEPGDSLHLRYSTTGAATLPELTGKGASKTAFLSDFKQFNLNKQVRENLPRFKATAAPFDALYSYIDSAGQAFLLRLQPIGPSMRKESFDLLKAEVMAAVWGQQYRGTTMLYNESIEQTMVNRKHALSPRSKAILQNILKVDESLYYAHNYVNEVYNIFFRQYSDLVMDGLISNNLTDKYNWLKQYLRGRLQVPVLTLFLESDISKLNQAEDLEMLIKETYTSPTDSVYAHYIRKYYNNVTSFRRGMPAPDFTIENEKGEKVNLAHFRGKVIYLDFWFATCGPCHALFSTIAPVKKYFANRQDVVFLNVSIDPRSTWLDALTKNTIAGYHAFTEGKGSSHPIIGHYKVAAYPTTCLIDKKGNIFLATPSTKPDELTQQIEQALTR
ncbi:TlpA family protein disulfide reductase [Paraflavitalea pollutisoli]|uniref:TlpA family protein disulfide reductase n=1 Tax=Paraflavitalea pollutisoli TaxID=3034143 RepID=UPI0023ED6A37|nr:TlpA disulfide reductase family protein [Paraflavitalea sp. H1-2-19X]